MCLTLMQATAGQSKTFSSATQVSYLAEDKQQLRYVLAWLKRDYVCTLEYISVARHAHRCTYIVTLMISFLTILLNFPFLVCLIPLERDLNVQHASLLRSQFQSLKCPVRFRQVIHAILFDVNPTLLKIPTPRELWVPTEVDDLVLNRGSFAFYAQI